MIKKKKRLVSLEKSTLISYWLSLALLLRIDRKGWREWLSKILSFPKLRKAAPPKPHPSFPPFNERPSPHFLFICGSGPDGLFHFLKRWFRESTNRQIRSPGDSQPPSRPNEMGWNKSISFLIDSGRSEAKFNQGKGAYFSWRWVILFKFSYANGTGKVFRWYGPQEMNENLQLLRGRTPLGGRKILSFYNSFSHTPLPSFTEEERRIFQADRDLNFH